MRKHPVLAALAIVAGVFGLFMLSVYVLVHSLGRGEAYVPGEKVAVIEVSGILTDSKSTIDKLEELREDDSVKALVIRIDSPGGAVGPAQELYEELRKTIREKKCVASLGGVAASGGYYIAAACDKIVSNPGTITGSIGVLMEYSNVQGLLNKLGVQAGVLKAGKYKDAGSPFRPMQPEERALIQGVIDSVHQQFIRAVAEGRKMPKEKVAAIADGRILSGEQAKNFGLVDQLGNLQDAVDLAGKLGGIKGKAKALYVKKTPFSFWEWLMGDDDGSSALLRLGYNLHYLTPGTPQLR
jgi:protease-4